MRVTGVGPNHTRGDTVMFVEEDRVLFTGDVVMPVFPSGERASRPASTNGSRTSTEFEALAPRVVVPAHGRLIDVATLRRYREYLTAVRDETRAAKRQGQSVEEAQQAARTAAGATIHRARTA